MSYLKRAGETVKVYGAVLVQVCMPVVFPKIIEVLFPARQRLDPEQQRLQQLAAIRKDMEGLRKQMVEQGLLPEESNSTMTQSNLGDMPLREVTVSEPPPTTDGTTDDIKEDRNETLEKTVLSADVAEETLYSCFISYSSQDQAFVERLHEDLRNKGLRCWFAPEDLRIGERFNERIEESIQRFDKVMIVLSRASVQSPWVEREVNAAREREDREKCTILFPIRIDDAVMMALQPWAADIRRSRHIGDFRGWEDYRCYESAFQRLVRDLKAS